MTIHVDSPKSDAPEGILGAIEKAASAMITMIEGVVNGATEEISRALGKYEEDRKGETSMPAVEGKAESDVLVGVLSDLAGVGGISLVGDVMGDRLGDPEKASDVANAQKSLGGMVGKKVTSFEKMFKIDSPVKGRGDDEKIGAHALYGGTKNTDIKGAKSSIENAATLKNTCDYASSLGKANEQVLGQVKAVRAMQGPARAQQIALGGCGMQLTNNGLANGPTGPTIDDEVAEA